MNIENMSLPNTCFSCQHYQQKGWKHDDLAPRFNKYGSIIEPKKQRIGQCLKNGGEVFWNEKCHLYIKEPDIDVHACPVRKELSDSKQGRR